MKKIFVLFLLVFLCACSPKQEEYYNLSFADYDITVGYDSAEYLAIVFECEITDILQAYDSQEDIQLKYFGKDFGLASISNYAKKPVTANKAIVSSLEFYLADTGFSEFSIDGIKLDESIVKNCETFNGQLVQRNGYACVIEQTVGEQNNGIILYGNVANIEQDTLDRIEIFVK